MTGRLAADLDPTDPYLRAWWKLDDRTVLGFRDVRRFGRIRVAHGGDYEGLLAQLGPEPFSEAFSAAHLYRVVKSSRRRVKTQLLSQKPVAGVGNIYADEACFRAGVHPGARSLTRTQAAALHEAIVYVLRQGIDHGGTTLRDYVDVDGSMGENQHHLLCYGRYGEPCVRCGQELLRSTIDARTTTWCRTCQRR